MRGPGPRWHAKRDAAVAAHDGGIGVRNWPTTKFAVIVTAAVLSVVFLLSIVTSIIASSSSSLPAAPLTPAVWRCPRANTKAPRGKHCW